MSEHGKVKKTLAPRCCATCKIQKQVMMTMEPGDDGIAWWLCVPCYLEGLRKWNQGAA